VRVPEIGVKYAGTATGLMSTIQVVGSVLLPGNVIVPAAGGNFNILFLICSLTALLACLCLIGIKMPRK